jgi:hypothetical protein
MEKKGMSRYTPVQWLQEVTKKSMSYLYTANANMEDVDLKDAYEEFPYEKKQLIHKMIREQFEINDGIFVLAYLANILGIKEFCQDIAYNVQKGELDGITGSIMEYQLEHLGEVSYGQKRKTHRKNVERFARETGCEFPYIPVEKRNKNRIVIITAQILEILHAPTAMTLQTAYILKKYLGYEVMILTCACDRMLENGVWLGTCWGENSSPKEHSMLHYRDETIDVFHYPMSECDIADYREMLTRIYEWNPGFVLEMGVHNPVADLPQRFTTVVVRAMTVEAPVSDGDILIRNGYRENEKETEYRENLLSYQTQLFYGKKFPPVIQETGKKYTRQELALPENRFLVAVVGNRLEIEIDEEFKHVMNRIIQSDANVDFVVIGPLEPLEEEELKGHVHYMGYRTDLLEVCRVLDLYLNPRRQGGGWSSAIALKAGLPVVTLPECDVAARVGTEYVVCDYREMVDVVSRYVRDKHFYDRKKQLALENAGKTGDDESVDYVTGLIDKIWEMIACTKM